MTRNGTIDDEVQASMQARNENPLLDQLDVILGQVTALRFERDALAVQVVDLRGALEELDDYRGFAVIALEDEYVTARRAAALALPIPEAAAKYRAALEKADLVDAAILARVAYLTAESGNDKSELAESEAAKMRLIGYIIGSAFNRAAKEADRA